MISYVPTIKGGFGRPFFVFAFYFYDAGDATAASSRQIPATSNQIQATSLTVVKLVACPVVRAK